MSRWTRGEGRMRKQLEWLCVAMGLAVAASCSSEDPAGCRGCGEGLRDQWRLWGWLPLSSRGAGFACGPAPSRGNAERAMSASS